MLKNLLQVFRVPELRKKVFFVLGVFVVFRVMANIPIFAIDIAKLQGFFSQNQVPLLLAWGLTCKFPYIHQLYYL